MWLFRWKREPEPEESDPRDAPAQQAWAGEEFAQQAMAHLDTLYRVAYRCCRSRQDAEDLVQDTYERAYRYRASFTPGTNLRAWLLKMMVNIHINRYRRELRQPKSVPLDEDSPGEGERFSLYQQIMRQSGRPLGSEVEDALLEQVLGEEVGNALDRLPEQYRLALLLVGVEGFKYREAADIMGTNVGTVLSRVARARARLQEELWEYARSQGYLSSLAYGAKKKGNLEGR